MREISYDSRSYELAEHFLPDAPTAKVKELAQCIQTAVEDWFFMEEKQR